MQGSLAVKASFKAKTATGALLLTSLAYNTVSSLAEEVEGADDVLQACQATLSDRGAAWEFFLSPMLSAFYPFEIAKALGWK